MFIGVHANSVADPVDSTQLIDASEYVRALAVCYILNCRIATILRRVVRSLTLVKTGRFTSLEDYICSAYPRILKSPRPGHNCRRLLLSCGYPKVRSQISGPSCGGGGWIS